MKKRFSEKYPVIAAILWMIMYLIPFSVAMAITTILDLNNLLLPTLVNIVFSIIATIYLKKRYLSFKTIGISKPVNIKNTIYFIPIILIATVPIIFGGKFSVTSYEAINYLVLTLSVGYFEEILGRGVLYRIVESVKGKCCAVLVSSIIFGVAHMANALGGKDIIDIILQIGFAFLIGILLAELMIITKSIIPGMIYHFLHDFIAFTYSTPNTKLKLVWIIAYTLLAAGSTLYLFAVCKKEKLFV